MSITKNIVPSTISIIVVFPLTISISDKINIDPFNKSNIIIKITKIFSLFIYYFLFKLSTTKQIAKYSNLVLHDINEKDPSGCA